MAETHIGMTEDLYKTIVAVVDERVREIKVTRDDFNELKGVVRDLAFDLNDLKEVVKELAEAQRELAQAQARTEKRLDELAQAQARTEKRLDELAQAQARTEKRLDELVQVQTRFERTFESQMGAMGARWGMYTEESFRQGMRAILEDIGFKVERYLVYDKEGKVFDRPEQVELDVIVHNGKLMVLEIKSSTDRADVAIFNRKVGFYYEREGRNVDRRIIISPYVEDDARKLALAMDTEIYTRADDMGEKIKDIRETP